jgi:hypothetical protein
LEQPPRDLALPPRSPQGFCASRHFSFPEPHPLQPDLIRRYLYASRKTNFDKSRNIYGLRPRQWRARYRDETGKEHAKHFARKADAQRWLDEVTASMVSGEYVDPRAGRVTFKAYAEQWRTSQVHRVTPHRCGVARLAMCGGPLSRQPARRLARVFTSCGITTRAC